jgi:hypothetical protein
MAGRAQHSAPAGRPSFVAAMVEVWKRPSLTALEVLWRWGVGGLLIGAASYAMQFKIPVMTDHTYLLRNATVLQPMTFVEGFLAVGTDVVNGVWPLLRWLAPLALVAWVLAATLGRTLWLRRLDPALATRRPTFALLALLQLSKLVAMLGTWVGCWALAVRVAVVAPTARHEDPNLVLFAAMIIGLTLLVFVGRSMTSWILQLAPLISMTRNVSVRKSIVMAIRAPKALRSKLIETNLVMGIAKVALLVLAMVFSACPLPFSSVETQAFLTCWWIGVGVWWLLASDYFHVVRIVAVLRLLQANDILLKETASSGGNAS